MNNFSLHSYVSLIDTEGKWRVAGSEEMYQLVNFLINSGMTVNRWIYQVVDLSLQILLSNTVFEDTIGRVFKTAISTYHSLFDTLGTILFLIALVIIFFIYVFKSPQESFKKMVVLFAVIGMNVVIYTNGEEYLKDINTIFDEAEVLILRGVKLPFDGQEEAGSEKSLRKIRDTYFNMTLQQAFAMVNFGTPIYEERFDQFLYTEEQENNEEAKESLLKRISEESEGNRYMTPDGSLDKWFLSVYAWVNNLFVGVPLLVMAALKFLLKILILCMVFGLPPISLLSLIPKFSSMLFNLLGKMMLLFFIGIFLSLAVYLFFFVMTLIDSSIHVMAGNNSLISSVLGTVNKAALILFFVKGKTRIVSLITVGNITRIAHGSYKHPIYMKSDREKKNEFSPPAKILSGENGTSFEETKQVVDFREILVVNKSQKYSRETAESAYVGNEQKAFREQSNSSFNSEKIKEERVADSSEHRFDHTTNNSLTENGSLEDVGNVQRSNVYLKRKTETEGKDLRGYSLEEQLTYKDDALESETAFYQLLEELRTC